MGKFSAVLAALLVAGLAVPVVAAETTIGVELTKAKIEDESLDNGFKLFLNHMVSDNFGFEVAHGKYGEYSTGYYDGWDVYSVNAEFSATNFALIGAASLSDSVSVFGKLGLSMWKVDAGGYGSNSDDGDDVLIGFGLNFDTGSNASFKIEYESIQVEDVDATSINFGLGFRF